MNKYKVWIMIPQEVVVDAVSKEEAEKIVLKNLIQSKQLKEIEPFEIKIFDA